MPTAALCSAVRHGALQIVTLIPIARRAGFTVQVSPEQHSAAVWQSWMGPNGGIGVHGPVRHALAGAPDGPMMPQQTCGLGHPKELVQGGDASALQETIDDDEEGCG